MAARLAVNASFWRYRPDASYGAASNPATDQIHLNIVANPAAADKVDLRWRKGMEEEIPRPRADRRQLQQIISGLTEGIVLLEPDGAIVWANETAVRIHGVESLEDLGHTAAGYRKRFKLRYRNHRRVPPRSYPIERALRGENFSDVIVELTRAGNSEHRWMHRVRSLTLVDAAGRPDCIALAIHDLTDYFSAEERFEQTFAANPAPAMICRLSDMRYIKVNDGFLEMTGYTREDLIGRCAYELDLLDGAEKRELAIERLMQGHTIPQMETRLRLPDGNTKFMIVAGQPIEVGEDRCMLFTFADLDPRKQAEDALRQSEERFSTAFRLAPVPMTLSTLDGFRLVDVNEAFISTTGYQAREVLGKSAAQIALFGGAAQHGRIEHALAGSPSPRNIEIQLRTRSGDLLECSVSAEIVTIGQQPCVLSVMHDITERKRSERELLEAIEAVMQDASWFSRTVIEKLANIRSPGSGRADAAVLADLTERERDVLGLICRGLPDHQIAAKLRVARNTVRNHISSIYAKIDVHTRSAAVVWARERGFDGEGIRGRQNQHN
jgi:PAS domain S-box-containing protein